jgi:two-component system OmpR family sensor kinase
VTADPLDRLAVLVHEVRSPVAAVAAISEAFVTASGQERGSLVGLATAACRAIERLVVDAAAVSIRLEDVDLAHLARDAAAAARLGGSDVHVTAEPPALVRADPVRLRQALDNLLANASRHAPGSAIAVEVAQADGWTRMSVSDRGPGVPGAARERIFMPGVRFGDAEGSGLGLALARAIADAHGGTLTLESRPGVGATFTLALPSAQV